MKIGPNRVTEEADENVHLIDDLNKVFTLTVIRSPMSNKKKIRIAYIKEMTVIAWNTSFSCWWASCQLNVDLSLKFTGKDAVFVITG